MSEVLENLGMDMEGKDNKISESEKEFYTDLCNTQAEIAEKVFIRTKKGYNYNYTPLNEIMPELIRILTKNHMGIIQYYNISEGFIKMETILFHKNGFQRSFPSIMPIIAEGKVNVAQSYGATLTYLRRYSVSVIFGITTEEDNDGNIGLTKSAKPANTSTTANTPNVSTSKLSTPELIKAIEGLGLTYKQVEDFVLITSDYNACISKKSQLKGLGFIWDPTNKAWIIKVN